MAGLKTKSKQTLDLIAGNPDLSHTDAYLLTHKTENRISAGTNAYKLLSKPTAQIYLKKHIDRARSTVVDLLDSKKDDIRLRSAQDIIDREYGRATQRVENNTTAVTLTIDLTSTLDQE